MNEATFYYGILPERSFKEMEHELQRSVIEPEIDVQPLYSNGF